MTKIQSKRKSSVSSSKIPFFVADPSGKYTAKKPLTAEQIIESAKKLLSFRVRPGQSFNSPWITATFLQLEYEKMEHEVFACLFLDNQNCLIAHEVLFRGTIDSASVYPREVVKRALDLNAAAIIFAHNHPSGICEPSWADLDMTQKLKSSLALFDIRSLDHFIVGKFGSYSMAEHGQI